MASPKKWQDFKRFLRMQGAFEAPQEIKAEFYLVYGDLKIGTLEADNGLWTFKYTDEFRGQSKIRPIIEFPDVDKTYKSKELWPFFQMRIPGLSQSDVETIMKQEGIDEHDTVKLLKKFGRETIANPFKLIAAC